jgi:hypothetical protein
LIICDRLLDRMGESHRHLVSAHGERKAPLVARA